MKRKTTRILCLVLALCTLLCTGAFAAETSDDALSIRVNGKTVVFPDSQPYVDENSRTMVPVRFITEQLGAEVTWNDAEKTAIVEKNGIKVEIPIDSTELTVTKDGVSETITMDTCAVLKENRTFIPLRYIAEALGAYVDYSDVYRTVGIYADVLTAEQIEYLRSIPYTQPDGAVGYETGKQYYSGEQLDRFYGTVRASFGTYANAKEYLYHIPRGGKYGFESLNLTLRDYTDTNEFYANVVDEARSEAARNTEHFTVEFLTDSSCIYQPDDMDGVECTVRGIAKVRLHVKPTQLAGEETAYLCRLGFHQLYQDVDMYIPVDIHMTTLPGYKVSIHTIVPLGEAW